MGRARVVSPPPVNYEPEPLVSPPAPPAEEATGVDAEQVSETSIQISDSQPVESFSWKDGSMLEEQEALESAKLTEEEAERERERIAKEKHDELLRRKEEEQKAALELQAKIVKAEEILKNPPVKIEKVVEYVHLPDPKLLAEMDLLRVEVKNLKENQTPAKANQILLKQLEDLRKENAILKQRNEESDKQKQEAILKARKQTTEQKKIQLNLVKQEKPSIKARIKDWWKKRKQIKATEVKSGDYQLAIMQRAIVGIPKILDDMEKIHDELTILEMLLKKHNDTVKKGR